MAVKTIAFWRDIEGNDLTAGLADITAEVNTYLASFSDRTLIRGVETVMASATVSMSRHTFIVMTVTYLG